MIKFTRPLPQLGAEILQRTERNLRKFSDLGIDSRLDVISFENVEYVANLLAQEAALPGYVRDAQDRDIVLRVCDQFLASDIPELCEWAILELRRNRQELEQQIQKCQAAISEMLDRLEQLEVTTCN